MIMAVQYDYIVQHMMVKFFKYPMVTYLILIQNILQRFAWNVTGIVHFVRLLVKVFMKKMKEKIKITYKKSVATFIQK